jgi:hypothetical protein
MHNVLDMLLSAWLRREALPVGGARRWPSAVVREEVGERARRRTRAAAPAARGRADGRAARAQAFVGSFLAMTSCVTVPALCYLAIRRGEPMRAAERIGVRAVAALGVVLAVAGTADSVLQISAELGAR